MEGVSCAETILQKHVKYLPALTAVTKSHNITTM